MKAPTPETTQQQPEDSQPAPPEGGKAETPPVVESEKVEPDETEPVEEIPKGDETPKGEKVLPNRIGTAQFNDVEQEAIALGKALKEAGEPVPSLKERIEYVEAKRAKASAASVPQPSQESANRAVLVKEFNETASQIAEIEEKIKAHTNESGLITDEYRDMERQKGELERRQHSLEQGIKDTLKAARAESRQTAIEIYPDAGNRNSALGREISALVGEINADPEHPEKSILLADTAPELIAERAATRLAKRIAAEKGITVAEAKASLMAASKGTGKAPVQQTKKITTAPGGASAPTPAPQQKAIDLGSKDFDPDLYEKALYGDNKKGLVMTFN